jgi:hypothetical protein
MKIDWWNQDHINFNEILEILKDLNIHNENEFNKIITHDVTPNIKEGMTINEYLNILHCGVIKPNKPIIY